MTVSKGMAGTPVGVPPPCPMIRFLWWLDFRAYLEAEVDVAGEAPCEP